jgi:hypothetical protein
MVQRTYAKHTTHLWYCGHSTPHTCGTVGTAHHTPVVLWAQHTTHLWYCGHSTPHTCGTVGTAHHTPVVLRAKRAKLNVHEVTLDSLFAALQIILALSVMSSIKKMCLGYTLAHKILSTSCWKLV